jgi:hypothetical protein
MVKIGLAISNVSFVFSKSLEVHDDCTPGTTNVLKAAMFGGTNKHKEKSAQEMTMSGLCKHSFMWVP